jgi:carbonic anhydrase
MKPQTVNTHTIELDSIRLYHFGILLFIGLIFACVMTFAEPPSSSEKKPAAISSFDALHKLIEGNQRFASGKSIHPSQTAERRTEISKGQYPFAIILGCSDSRASPEVIFDQGLGDLFVIRVAGNVTDDHAIASIEYAAEHLHVPLVVVLGHEKCGAVKATLDGGHAAGHIPSLIRSIQPAVEATKGNSGDPLDNAVQTNAILAAAQLQATEPILSELVKSARLKIIPARYDLDTGKVEWLGTDGNFQKLSKK